MGKWVKSKNLSLADQAQAVGLKIKAKDNQIKALVATQLALTIVVAVLAYLILK